MTEGPLLEFIRHVEGKARESPGTAANALPVGFGGY
jgi:hypothetical protein